MKKLFTLLLLGTLLSCTDASDFKKGKQQLEQQGYSDVVNTGHGFFCCSDNDIYSTGFKCKNAKGETVEGCFCSSTFKGVTIRFK